MNRTGRLGVVLIAATAFAGCLTTVRALANDAVTLPPDLVAPEPGNVTLTGTLTEGPDCTAIRGDDGAVFSLVLADRGGLHVGDHVRVTGHLTEASVCMNGPTIVVDHIEATAAKDIIVK